VKLNIFKAATAKVQSWLDHGDGSAWAKRDSRLSIEKGVAWNIDLQTDGLPIRSVRILLPPDFPSSPCKLYVDRDCFLKLPHIEEDGHVCIGLTSIPDDYVEPVHAIFRALRTLKENVLAPSVDPHWVQKEFHLERASYWNQHCDRRKKAGDRRPTPVRTFVDAGTFSIWTEGALTAYVPIGAKHRRYSLQMATATVNDAHEIATRHKWAEGTMVKGNALFVQLPSELTWTPQTWPDSFIALHELVGRVTEHESLLNDWLRKVGWGDNLSQKPKMKDKSKGGKHGELRQAPPGQQPLLVVLVQDGVMFGYQLSMPVFPLGKVPNIEPIKITRVDPDWCLARDHQLPLIHDRRSKRVLLIGCGSLGSPLAGFIARAGVGHLDIVDSQLMGTENTSRHELGVLDAGFSKAVTLASRLMKDVPGLTARGFFAEAADWTTTNCRPGDYDLVIECTAESAVRTFISHARREVFGDCPVVHSWTEPFCSAGHVVLTQLAVPWPAIDPADSLVNASDLSAEDTRINLPACSGGFHPYGAADIAFVAAFVAERVIAVLDDLRHVSTVWSWVRSSAYFETLPVRVTTRPIVPSSSSNFDSATMTRALANVLEGE
jgi:hypothetical protein